MSCLHQAGRQHVPFYLQNAQHWSLAEEIQFLARKKQHGLRQCLPTHLQILWCFFCTRCKAQKDAKWLCSLQCYYEKGETSQRTSSLSLLIGWTASLQPSQKHTAEGRRLMAAAQFCFFFNLFFFPCSEFNVHCKCRSLHLEEE